MNPFEPDSAPFFAYAAAKLGESNIPYMVTGSMGCTVYGEPRATNDVDIVFDPTREQLLELVTDFLEYAYVSEEAALEAYRRRSMFNVISNETVEKIDLIFLKDTPYQKVAFERRVLQDFGCTEAVSVTAEDAILSKLSWSRKSLSEVQFRDIVGIAKVSSNNLDWDYLGHWGKELNVLPRLREVLEEIKSDIVLD